MAFPIISAGPPLRPAHEPEFQMLSSPHAVFHRFFHTLLALLCLVAASAHAEDDLLEPEKAFVFSARMVDAAVITCTATS